MELYIHEVETSDFDIEDPSTDYVQKKNVFYIVVKENGIIQKLTRFNYNQVLKKELAGNPELARKFGTKGFHYGDLEKILIEHI